MQAPRRAETGRPPTAQFAAPAVSILEIRRVWEGDETVEMVTADLVARARGGDGDAFRELVEPYRRELHVHCYRILGSFQDAEDTLQETLLAAWQGLAQFEERASVRTWLYRIATNRCLNALRSASRRPARDWNFPGIEPPEPTRLGEVAWLEPYPDSLLDAATAAPLGPEARYEQAEAISLAFVTALQVLPARQRAVLILRDVLGYHADEAAGILDSTVESVNSALKRARASLQRLPRPEPPPAPGTAAEQALVADLVRAYQSGNVDALIALLTEDVRVSMPPIPLEYLGHEAVAGFYSVVMRHRAYRLVPTRANGQPAFGTYLRTGTGRILHGAGLLVATLSGARISALTRFDNDVLPWFGLPRSLPAWAAGSPGSAARPLGDATGRR
jgi:RNA polymerase sigma-70 factor (TIGR02960 family)